MSNVDYAQQILSGWEDVHKKGQLTLWVLLALKENPKHMGVIKQFVSDVTNGTMTVDDKSLYRALKRYHEAELTIATNEPGVKGPDRKVYMLSPLGRQVLKSFIDRNIVSIFYQLETKKLLEKE